VVESSSAKDANGLFRELTTTVAPSDESAADVDASNEHVRLAAAGFA
jgi:hypothetical protein